MNVAEPSVDMGLADEGEILGRITRWLVHLAWHHHNLQLRNISPSYRPGPVDCFFARLLWQEACEHKSKRRCAQNGAAEKARSCSIASEWAFKTYLLATHALGAFIRICLLQFYSLKMWERLTGALHVSCLHGVALSSAPSERLFFVNIAHHAGQLPSDIAVSEGWLSA